MLNIAYDPEKRRAILTWDNSEKDADWVRLLRRVFLDHTDEATQLSPEAMSLPWWTFLSARSQIKEILSGYKIALNADPATKRLLALSAANEASYAKAQTAPSLSPEIIVSRLAAKGFLRKLTKEQLRNIGKLAGLTAGATFSVRARRIT